MGIMTAAFVLGINLFIAAIFAVAFGVVAATSRTERGAKWLAGGYATGIATILLEYIMPYQTHPAPVGIAIFLTYLLAMTFCIAGVARHYRFAPPWRTMAAIWTASIVLMPLTFTIEYGSPVRVALFQYPYLAMQLLVLVALLRSGHRQKLDLLLAGVMVVAGAIYFTRPLIAWLANLSGPAQGYLTTSYAAISQSLGAGTLMAQALVILLIMMRDTTAEIMATSETDSLSGLLNRRGFDAHAGRGFERARGRGLPAVLIAADLDHFKAINDSFGHATGDRVIAHFAQMLRRAAPDGAVVGRPGGEEFVILLAGQDLAEARGYAERVRRDFAAHAAADMGLDRPLSASFGIAATMRGDTLSELSRRADAALYRAKSGGRNRVAVALGELPSASALGVA